MEAKMDKKPGAGNEVDSGVQGGHAHERTALTCDYCLKELADSDAIREEGQDYVAHFCGLDCLSAWRERHTHERKLSSQ